MVETLPFPRSGAPRRVAPSSPQRRAAPRERCAQDASSGTLQLQVTVRCGDLRWCSRPDRALTAVPGICSTARRARREQLRSPQPRTNFKDGGQVGRDQSLRAHPAFKFAGARGGRRVRRARSSRRGRGRRHARSRVDCRRRRALAAPRSVQEAFRARRRRGVRCASAARWARRAQILNVSRSDSSSRRAGSRSLEATRPSRTFFPRAGASALRGFLMSTRRRAPSSRPCEATARHRPLALLRGIVSALGLATGHRSALGVATGHRSALGLATGHRFGPRFCYRLRDDDTSRPTLQTKTDLSSGARPSSKPCCGAATRAASRTARRARARRTPCWVGRAASSSIPDGTSRAHERRRRRTPPLAPQTIHVAPAASPRPVPRTIHTAPAASPRPRPTDYPRGTRGVAATRPTDHPRGTRGVASHGRSTRHPRRRDVASARPRGTT